MAKTIDPALASRLPEELSALVAAKQRWDWFVDYSLRAD